MAVIAAVTSALFFVFGFAVGPRLRSTRPAHGLAFAFALLALLNSILHLYLSAEPQQSTNLILLAVGAGYFMLSRRWLAATLATLGVTWTIVMSVSAPSPLWLHFGLALLTSFLLSCLINLVRTRMLKRLHTMILGEEQRLGQLNAAVLSIQNSEAKYRLLAENATDLIARYTLDGECTYASPACQSLLGYDARELEGTSIYYFVHPDDMETIHDSHRATVGQEGTYTATYRMRRKDGTYVWFESTSKPLAHAKDNDLREIVVVSRDITERRAVERMKDEFISTVSHELRTPLTSILGSLNLVINASTGLPEHVKKLVDIAYRNSERLSDLVSDLLDIERIETGKMTFEFTAVELMPLVERAIEESRTSAAKHNVECVLTEAPPGLQVLADNKRLRQVLGNLLSNAIKFSPPDTQVEVSVCTIEDMVRVSVSDHGPGISEEFREHIFEKFTQVDSSNTRQKGGTGLGLTIVKSIVEKHGGSVNFKTREGKGTTFYFDLPTDRVG